MNKNVKRIFAAAVSAVTLATASFSASAMNLVAPYEYKFTNIYDGLNADYTNQTSPSTFYHDWWWTSFPQLRTQLNEKNIAISKDGAGRLCFTRTETTDADTGETTYGTIWQKYSAQRDVQSLASFEFNNNKYTGLATGKAKYVFEFNTGDLYEDDDEDSEFSWGDGASATGQKLYGQRAVARYTVTFLNTDNGNKGMEMYIAGQTKNQYSEYTPGVKTTMNTVRLLVPYYDTTSGSWTTKQFDAWIVPGHLHRVEFTVDMRSEDPKWTYILKDMYWNSDVLHINTDTDYELAASADETTAKKANIINTSNIKGVWPNLKFELLSNRRNFTLGQVTYQCQRFDVLSTTVDDTTDNGKITANAKIAQDLKWTGWADSEDTIQGKGAEASPLMVLAAYDDNGKMIGATCKTNSEWTNDKTATSTTVPTGDNVTLELNKSDLDGTYSYSKLFVWSTKNELMPYTEAVSTKD